MTNDPENAPRHDPDPDPETALIQQMIDELVALFPETWEDASLTYRAIGDNELIMLGGSEKGRRYPSGIRAAERRIPRTGIPDLLRRHREITYHPDYGAWAGFKYKLWKKNGVADWGVSGIRPDKTPRRDEIGPADCAAELQRYPRPDDGIPGWMRPLLDLHRAAQTYGFAPQRERDLVALLPAGLERLFAQARVKLADFVPGAGTLHVGAPGEGRWTVAHVEGAWLAVGPGGDVVPYAEPQQAVAHAMAGIMAEAGMEISSAVLDKARIVSPRRLPREGQHAWMTDDAGRELNTRTVAAPRPRGGGPYIALDRLHNRPAGPFVCHPGPAPEEGAYASVHEVLMMLAEGSLPKPAPTPEAAPEPPSEVLEPGMEVDAYGDPVNCFVYEIGTPFLRRGLPGSPGDHDYHVYRVERPVHAYTGLFAPGPLGSDPPPPDTGMGFYLVDSIADLIASGHLVEITGDRPRE